MPGFTDANGKTHGLRLDTQTIIDWELRTGAGFLELARTQGGIDRFLGTMHYMVTLAWLAAHDSSVSLDAFVSAIKADQLKQMSEAVGEAIRIYVEGPGPKPEAANQADPQPESP